MFFIDNYYWLIMINIDDYWLLLMSILWIFMNIDSYLCLFLSCCVSVVCINGDTSTFFSQNI